MLKTVLLCLDVYHYFLLLFIIWFLCFNFLQHKNMEQHFPVIIFIPDASAECAGQFEGQSDCCEQDWFTVRI